MSEWFPRRAHKTPTGFFFAWGFICALALIGGIWMLNSGMRYREGHQSAEATVTVDKGKPSRNIRPTAHLRYDVQGKSYELILKRPNGGKELVSFDETYRQGAQVTVSYPNGDPQAADVEGDRGVLLGGTVFTAVGVFFSLGGALAFVAEFFPNKFVRFG
jgi:hypothetical protein